MLRQNEIFVFGSNMAGRHGRGAALQAYKHFGAEYGVGEGFTGRCWAFPTLDAGLRQRTLVELRRSVEYLYGAARANPLLTFLLTKVGCGLAGYSEDTMRALFVDSPSNIRKPEGW